MIIKYQEGVSLFLIVFIQCIINWKNKSVQEGRVIYRSPKWLKNKKATTSPNNNNNNCFQYALSAALNYQNIENHPERISNLKPFINQYN